MADEEIPLTPSGEASSAERAEAAAMELLAKIDPGDEPEVSPMLKAEMGLMSDEDDEPDPTETEDEPEVEEVAEAEATEPEPEAAPAPEANDDDYTRALDALRRNKFGDAEIKAMSKERLLEIGGHLAQRQEDIAATHAELRRLKSEAANATQAATDSGGLVESPAPSAGPPLDATVAKLREALDLDDDAVPVLSEWGNAITAPLVAQLQQAQQAMQAQAQMQLGTLKRMARDDLMSEFPGMKEADSYQKVLAQFTKLNPQAYATDDPSEGVRSMMYDAASVVFRGQTATDAVRKQATKDRRKGLATAPTSKATLPTKELSAFERFSQAAAEAEAKYGVRDGD